MENALRTNHDGLRKLASRESGRTVMLAMSSIKIGRTSLRVDNWENKTRLLIVEGACSWNEELRS